MSKKAEISVNKPVKKQALGRGLGSLLGIDEPESPKEIELLDESGFEAASTPAFQSGFEEKPLEETKTELAPAPTAQPAPAPQIPDDRRIWHVAIENVEPNKDQPRRHFSEPELQELASSIKVQGILQPIVARPMENGQFQIIAGERRWRAAQQAGLKEVPVILKDTGDQHALELALIENIQRADLNAIEEAEAFSMLITEYGLTQQQVAEKVGKDRATVANLLRLLNLSKEVREKVAQGQLTMSLAKVLLAVTDPKKQRQLANKIINQALTVRAAERLVKKRNEPNLPVDQLSQVDVAKKMADQVAQELQKLLGTKVSLDYNSGKGKVAIHFYSDEELNHIVERIKG